MATTGVILEGVATPADFNWPVLPDWDATLGPDASFWLSPAADRVTISSVSGVDYVTAGVGRDGTAYTGGPSPRGPHWVPSGLNNRPALLFPNASERKYFTVADALPWAGDFSVMAVVDLDASEATTRTIVRTTAAGNPSFYINVLSTDRIDVSLTDADGHNVRALTPVGSIATDGDATIVVLVTWNLASHTLMVSLDMGHSSSQDVDAAVSLAGAPAAEINVGATNSISWSLIGTMSELYSTPYDVLSSAEAQRLSDLRTYVLGAFRIDLT
jgi:hypothetical protein